MLFIKQKSDILGTFASALCLVHCVATPFIFIAQAGAVACCDTPPSWWKFIDYIFLTISFFAVYWSTQTTTISWIKPMLWLNWLVLLFIIVNEKLGIFSIAEAVIYIPAIALVLLHLYNRKYCKCKSDGCCVNES